MWPRAVVSSVYFTTYQEEEDQTNSKCPEDLLCFRERGVCSLQKPQTPTESGFSLLDFTSYYSPLGCCISDSLLFYSWNMPSILLPQVLCSCCSPCWKLFPDISKANSFASFQRILFQSHHLVETFLDHQYKTATVPPHP